MKNEYVDKSDIEDKTIINQKERNSCPRCGSIRIIKRIGYYGCSKCGWKGNRPKKIMWYFGIPYKGGSPIIGRIISPSVRDRNFCPICNSVRVRKRIHTQDHFCDNCGWVGNNPKKMKWGSTIIKL